MTFGFDWPWLLLLLPLPWVVNRLLPAAPPRRAALRVPFYQQVGGTEGGADYRPAHRGRAALLWLIWLLLLLSAARPQWVGEPQPVALSGRNLMLAVDISGSMDSEDMLLDGARANRLQVVKRVLGDFVVRRASDRQGLILFGTQAYTQVPLTFDHLTLARLLDEAQIGFAGEKTAIGDAIGLAIKRLREAPAESRVLVLLTDGANTAGRVEPLDAAAMAAGEGIRIYTLGFGAEEVEVRGLFGTRRINPSADLDETTLRGIAARTGGRYFRARDREELAAVYAALDELEPVEQEAEVVRPRQALFHWPLALVLLLSFAWAAFALYRGRRTLPADAEAAR
ncbi:VWA domain-containing protein [Motiliproteus sp. SC1-56]|uniref:vWA domain-containing protein n=1 Tax=Motiliproteus sp. SC1-56 TaxID=2799565 RepID=UPI001A907FCF|nr:VWA domain-containing protein [Motiliproteus sp. SC1-56]